MMPASTPVTNCKLSSSAKSEKNMKIHQTPPPQRKAASLVRHNDMVHEYVQANDILKSAILKSTLVNNKMYHGQLNDNKSISYEISKSVYEIFMKM